MVRTGLYLLAGALLGLAVHLVVILALPGLASNGAFTRLAEIDSAGKTQLIPVPAAGEPNPFRLDPGLSYAVCRLDLRSGPGELTGTLPVGFWSVAIYDQSGTVIYSTTNRDSVGQTLDLGVFDAAQTRLLAEQKINIAAGLLIVESRTDDVFVVVRLAPPQPVMRERYEAQLAKLACRNIRV